MLGFNYHISLVLSTIAVSGYYGFTCIPFIILYTIACHFCKNISKPMEKVEWKLMGFLTILVIGVGTGSAIIADSLMELWRLPVPPFSPPSFQCGAALGMAIVFIASFFVDIISKPRRFCELIVCFMNLLNGVVILSCAITDFIEWKMKG